MRTYLAVTLALFVGLLGYGLGLWQSYANRDRVIALSWGDGAMGKQFYGAKVTLEPDESGFKVRPIILIGPYGVTDDIGRLQDCGIVGHVASADEAVKRYGTIVWKKDGLHIGDFFIRQNDFENDR